MFDIYPWGVYDCSEKYIKKEPLCNCNAWVNIEEQIKKDYVTSNADLTEVIHNEGNINERSI